MTPTLSVLADHERLIWLDEMAEAERLDGVEGGVVVALAVAAVVRMVRQVHKLPIQIKGQVAQAAEAVRSVPLAAAAALAATLLRNRPLRALVVPERTGAQLMVLAVVAAEVAVVITMPVVVEMQALGVCMAVVAAVGRTTLVSGAMERRGLLSSPIRLVRQRARRA